MADPQPASAPPSPAWTGGRRWAARLNALAGVLCFAAILVFVNIYSARHWIRYDLTATREYELLDRTRRLLADLKTPLRIHPFFTVGAGDFIEEDAMYRLRQLLDEFRRESPLVQTEELSTGMDRRRLEAILRDLQLKTRLDHASVIVHAGERNKMIPLESMFQIDKPPGQMPRIRAFIGEALLVAAIEEVTGTEAPVIHYARGHGGEGRTDRTGPTDMATLSYIVNSLHARENFDHRPLDLVSSPQIPPDCKVLVIQRPEFPYRDAEVAALRDFLRRGGRLCFLPGTIDWREVRFAETGLEGLLREWGVVLQPAVVYANVRNEKGQRSIDRVQRFGDADFGDHPIVGPLKREGRPVTMDFCRPLAKADGADAALDVAPLIVIPAGAWGETSIEQVRQDRPVAESGDIVGSIPVAFAVRAAVRPDVKDPLSAETRIVVFGNADFVTDAQAQRDGNEALFTNALQWLLNRQRSMGVGRLLPDRRISLDEIQQGRLRWMGFTLPVLTLAAGIGVWMRRRS